MFSNKVYDFLKAIAQFILPAVTTLYATLGDIWGLPYVVQISATLAAVNTFLGIILGISTAQYKKSDAYTDGTLKIDTSDPNTDRALMVAKTPFEEMKTKSIVTFKVETASKPIPVMTDEV